jgi:hypothetical protein
MAYDTGSGGIVNTVRHDYRGVHDWKKKIIVDKMKSFVLI